MQCDVFGCALLCFADVVHLNRSAVAALHEQTGASPQLVANFARAVEMFENRTRSWNLLAKCRSALTDAGRRAVEESVANGAPCADARGWKLKGNGGCWDKLIRVSVQLKKKALKRNRNYDRKYNVWLCFGMFMFCRCCAF